MPTLEGRLIAKWRKAQGLSQEELGARCPRALSQKAIQGYERNSSSMSLSNLLNVVRGLDACGEAITDEWCLAAFFLGPGSAFSRLIDATEESDRAHKELKREFERGGRRARRRSG